MGEIIKVIFVNEDNVHLYHLDRQKCDICGKEFMLETRLIDEKTNKYEGRWVKTCKCKNKTKFGVINGGKNNNQE